MSYFSAHLTLGQVLFQIDGGHSHSPSQARNSDPVPMYGLSVDGRSILAQMADLDHINIWNGYSNRLLLLIDDINTLKDDARASMFWSMSVAQPQHPLCTISTKILRIQHNLEHLVQTLPPSLSQQTGQSVSGGAFHSAAESGQEAISKKIFHVQIIAEAYRLAAMLLLNEAASDSAFFGPLSLSSTAGFREVHADPTILLPRPILTPAQKKASIRSVIQYTSLIVADADSLPISWPLWPLFVAACCCNSLSSWEFQGQEQALESDEKGLKPDQRAAWDILVAAGRKMPYANIEQAQRIVQLVWLAQESRPKQRSGHSRLGKFEWEAVIEDLGWMASFA